MPSQDSPTDPATGAVTDPDGDIWGSPPDAAGELGPPPPRGGRALPPTPAPDAMLALGPPPLDSSLGMAKWAYQLLMVQAYEVMRREQPDAERDKSVRAILRDAAKHQTDAARFDYMQERARARREIEAKKRGRAAGKPEKKGPPPASAKVIPLPLPQRRDG
jgi:hypothetical protein